MMMSDNRKQEILDFIYMNKDSCIPWGIVAEQFSEAELEELLERGLIFEPVLGYVKEV